MYRLDDTHGLIVRLASIAATIETQIRLGNPRFDRHRAERHTTGYREDMQYILHNRDYLQGSDQHTTPTTRPT